MTTEQARLRLGSAPITWGVCEIDGWGERRPFTRVLDEMTELGYEGTELGPLGYLPADPTLLRHELGDRGLSLMAAFCPVTLHRDTAESQSSRRQVLETSRLLRDLGAEFVVLADAGNDERFRLAGRVALDGSDGFSVDEWQRFADRIQGIAAEVRQLELRPVFHPEAGSFVETPQEIDRLCALTDGSVLGVCLDTGHIAYGGGDPVDMAERHRDRIQHVHLKDVDPEILLRVRRASLGYLEATAEGIFAPLGQGCVDVAGVLEALGARYRGWLIVEQDIRLGPGFPKQDPRRNAQLSLDFLRSVLTSATG